jgi:hypothetical protein
MLSGFGAGSTGKVRMFLMRQRHADETATR